MEEAVRAAVRFAAERAAETEREDVREIERLLAAFAAGGVTAEALAARILQNCAVTVNFHPDRFSTNGKTVVESLLADGKYHNQFVTGTSNGGLDAYMGGARDQWEKRLFGGAYHAGAGQPPAARPKYGALNVLHDADGACARFGSCFFTLRPHVLRRCTFAFGDSSSNPEVLGTAGHFFGILRAMLREAETCGRLLNRESCPTGEALRLLRSGKRGVLRGLGRNLDHCIEAHVHGPLDLRADVDDLYLDGVFAGTETEAAARRLCARYSVHLRWIPARVLDIRRIDDAWRGPLVRPLAARADRRFGRCSGRIDAAVIGAASRDSVRHFAAWADIGDENELFQNFKYLWHFVAAYGEAAEAPPEISPFKKHPQVL